MRLWSSKANCMRGPDDRPCTTCGVEYDDNDGFDGLCDCPDDGILSPVPSTEVDES